VHYAYGETESAAGCIFIGVSGPESRYTIRFTFRTWLHQPNRILLGAIYPARSSEPAVSTQSTGENVRHQKTTGATLGSSGAIHSDLAAYDSVCLNIRIRIPAMIVRFDENLRSNGFGLAERRHITAGDLRESPVR